MDVADELYDLLHPFDGTEEQSPYLGFRVGRIEQVFASADDVKESDDKSRFVGSVKIQWLDRIAPSNQLVPWSYPCFSNPLVKKAQAKTSTSNVSVGTTQTSTGSAYGIFYVPSEGDLVVCGFRGPADPVIVGYLPHNLYKQTLSTTDKTQQGLLSFGPFRQLKSGEFSILSQQQSEIYLDRSGAVQIIVQKQPSGSGTPPIDITKVPGIDTTELARINLGVTYDPTFTTPIKSPYGENVVCNVQLANGSRVQIDAIGNVDVQASGKMHMGSPSQMDIASGGAMNIGGLTALLSAVNGMTLGASSITMNNGSKGAARVDDPIVITSATDTAFIQLLTDFINTFNLHTHISGVPGNPTGPATPPLLDPAPTTITGKVSTGSGTVKIGN